MILPVWFYNLVGRETKQQTSLCKHSLLFILVFFLICKNFVVFNSKKRAANRSDFGRANGFYYTIIIHYQIAKISSSMQYSNTGTEILWEKKWGHDSKTWYEKWRRYLWIFDTIVESMGLLKSFEPQKVRFRYVNIRKMHNMHIVSRMEEILGYTIKKCGKKSS